MSKKQEWQISTYLHAGMDLALSSFSESRPLERKNCSTVSTARQGGKEHGHHISYQSCFSSPDKNNRSLRTLLMLFVQGFMPLCAGCCRSIILQRLKQLAGLSRGNFLAEQMGADVDNLHLAVHSSLLPHVQGKATVKPKANSNSKLGMFFIVLTGKIEDG